MKGQLLPLPDLLCQRSGPSPDVAPRRSRPTAAGRAGGLLGPHQPRRAPLRKARATPVTGASAADQFGGERQGGTLHMTGSASQRTLLLSRAVWSSRPHDHSTSDACSAGYTFLSHHYTHNLWRYCGDDMKVVQKRSDTACVVGMLPRTWQCRASEASVPNTANRSAVNLRRPSAGSRPPVSAVSGQNRRSVVDWVRSQRR